MSIQKGPKAVGKPSKKPSSKDDSSSSSSEEVITKPAESSSEDEESSSDAEKPIKAKVNEYVSILSVNKFALPATNICSI